MSELGENEISPNLSSFLLEKIFEDRNPFKNLSHQLGDETVELTYILDKIYVRGIFIILYSIVFFLCFFGNLAVVLVISLHWKMRSITKFCLGNLAFANLCVGMFCVYQNLSTLLMDSWLFGTFLCKMYYFINSLSHTASILILVVICTERYVAILHPLKSRQWLTLGRLKIVITTVWLLSAILCSPRLYFITTYHIPSAEPEGSTYDVICAPVLTLYDNHIFDMANFILLFLLPLIGISFLYTRIGLFLWRDSSLKYIEGKSIVKYHQYRINARVRLNSDPGSIPNHEKSRENLNSRGKCGTSPKSQSLQGLNLNVRNQGNEVLRSRKKINHQNLYHSTAKLMPKTRKIPSSMQKSQAKTVDLGEFETTAIKRCVTSNFLIGSYNCKRPSGGNFRISRSLENFHASPEIFRKSRSNGVISYLKQDPLSSCTQDVKCSKYSKKRRASGTAIKCRVLLKPRQAVVRMLAIIVMTFAFCNLPFHLRKLCQNYLSNYDFGSHFSNILTPLTFLLMYANCAVNPIIFAFMSKGFRSSFIEVIQCRFRRKPLVRRPR